MKKCFFVVVGVFIALSLMLSACDMTLGQKTCHKCGKAVGNDPVEAGGRSYCSYNCYMTEALFN